jgi:hypothetical protein
MIGEEAVPAMTHRLVPAGLSAVDVPRALPGSPVRDPVVRTDRPGTAPDRARVRTMILTGLDETAPTDIGAVSIGQWSDDIAGLEDRCGAQALP